MTDHTPRLILVIGTLAALASCNVSTPAHAGDPLPIVHGPRETFIHIGSPTPTTKATTTTTTTPKASGLSPLTFDSPALPASTYLHPAYPEARSYAAPSASTYGPGSTRTVGTVHTPHGSVHFDSTTKH